MRFRIYGAFYTSVEVVVVGISCEDVDAFFGECGCYGIISGERITTRSVHFGAGFGECFYENGCFFCDVEASGNFISFEGFRLGVLFSESH